MSEDANKAAKNNMIKRKVQALLFCLYTLNVCQAQQIHQLTWSSPHTAYINNSEQTVLGFVGAVYEERNNGMPSMLLHLEGVDVKDFKIFNLVFDTLAKQEQLLLPTYFTTDSISISITKAYQYQEIESIVSLLPIRYNAKKGCFEKLISFSYSYSAASLTYGKQGSRTAATGATSSVLSAGDWYKLAIASTPTSTGSGLYKIDYRLLKSILGSAVDEIDPNKIRLFGNGGGMLPEANSKFKYDDLQENAIYIEGAGDGKFNSGDYILFYGKGPDVWTYDNSKSRYRHQKNIYSDNSFYFLTVGDSLGKRVVAPDLRPDTSQLGSVAKFEEHLFYEKDEHNIIQSGRIWYGESFDNILSRDYTFSLEGLSQGSGVTMTSAVMSTSSTSTVFRLNVGGITNPQTINGISEYDKGVETTRDIVMSNISAGNLNATLTYDNRGNNNAVGYLSYFELNYKKDLRLYGNQTIFRTRAGNSNAQSKFLVDNASPDIQIWDITDHLNCKSLQYIIQDDTALFTYPTLTDKEFIVFKGSDFSQPAFVGKVKNQNLHSIGISDIPDLVIVTSEALENNARVLAEFRESHDHLKVAVVTTTQLYNEFSSGAQDITAIRNFMKLLFDRSTADDKLKYLLLFGATSYDYKDRIANNTNIVPIYETPESLNIILSQSSDDYFGFLNNNEGDWSNSGVTNKLDIGIGRLPVRSVDEAGKIVDKLIHYSASKDAFGKWRNKICIVADNADISPFYPHMEDAEVMAATIASRGPAFNVNKLYMDVFPLVSAPGGQISPAIKDALLKEINKGTLIVNYSGHGSEFLLAQENILDMEDISKLQNYDKLPFFVTATCEFGRFDDPGKFSGAESLVLNPKGGMIGLLSSTRPVYATSNQKINKAFYDAAFTFSGNVKPRLGDIMIGTKNNSIVGTQNINFTLLADPSMTLAYPDEEIVITKLNDSLVTTESNTIQALDKISISGEVRNNGALNSTYNGTVYVSIFDKPSTIKTGLDTTVAPKSFQLQNSIIFDGTASVTNGRFTISLIVSKDISYNYGAGKISLYSNDSLTTDAGGYYSDIIIGGSAPGAITDTIPPRIRLFMDDTTFVSGALTGTNTKLLAFFYDESGINISASGIGHEITCVLNESKEVISMNNYYSAYQNNYKNGKLEFPFSDLSPGDYTLKVKAWDTYNNSSEQYIHFKVVSDEQLQLSDVFNYPNPFSTQTTFQFNHNRAGDDLEISIKIYSMTGNLVKTLENRILKSASHVSEPIWDGRSDFGAPLDDGVYIYHFKVRSDRDGSEVSKHQKLVILK